MTRISFRRQHGTQTLPKTLLSKQWGIVSTGSIILFVVFLYLGVQWRSYFCDEFTCNSLLSLPKWVQSVKTLITGASGGACIMQLIRTIWMAYSSNQYNSNTLSAYVTVLTVMFISFSSEMVVFTGILDGIRDDALGVRTPLLQYIEWQITVPLMFYLNLTLDIHKQRFSNEDWTIIMGAYLGLVAASTTMFRVSKEYSVLAMMMSTLLFAYAAIANYLQASKCFERARHELCEAPISYLSYSIAKRRHSCSTYLLAILPIFPAIYAAKVFDFISNDETFVLFSIVNFTVKVCYALILMEGHVEVLDSRDYIMMVEKQSVEDKRSFLRYVFHEVRSPLNAITMGLHLLQDDNQVGSESREAIRMMTESTAYLSDSLYDVLAMQKLEEQMVAITMEKCDTRDLITSAISNCRDLVRVKGITCAVLFDVGVPRTIKCDCKLISRTISNLLSNAIKFSEPNSTVYISVTFGDVDDGCVTVHVMDQGQGISESDEKALFQPFVKLRPGEIKVNRGSGVGLAVCKGIIALHHGVIGYLGVPDNNLISKSLHRISNDTKHSNHSDDNDHKGHDKDRTHPTVTGANRGSHFFFSLPVSKDLRISCFETIETFSMNGNEIHCNTNSNNNSRTASNTVSNDVNKPNAMSSQALEPLKVLIVDDVPSNRKMLYMILNRHGFQCEIAEDGVQAVTAITHDVNKFDMVFIDNMMPNKSGVEATREIRQNGFDKLIMGITGNTTACEIDAFELAGADIVLPKPLQIRMLDQLLEKCNESRHRLGNTSIRREIIKPYIT